MTFKKFFLLHERKHFITLARFTEYVIDKLEDKISKKENGVRSGSVFKIPVGEYGTLKIKFYKGYSRRAHAQKNQWNEVQDSNSSVDAIYYPKKTNDDGGDDTIKDDGMIEVYVNPSKSKEYHYRDRKFEDIVDASLPKFIKDKLRHELSHAYEDIIKDVAFYKTAQYDAHETIEDYYNDDEEINANLNQFLTSELSINRDIMFKIQEGDINGAVSAFIAKLKTQEFIKNIKPENKVWVLKTVYTFVRDLVEKRQQTQGLPQQ